MPEQTEESNQVQATNDQSGGAQQAAPTTTTTTTQGQEQEAVTIDVSQNNQDNQDSQAAHAKGLGSVFCRCKDSLLKRPIQYDIVSIVFTLLILGGGVYGYVSKGSAISLVAGVGFGLLLAAATYYEGCRKNPYPMLVLLVFLGSMFGYRYFASDFKFMPSGLFTLLSAIMVARNSYLIYLKKKQQATSN